MHQSWRVQSIAIAASMLIADAVQAQETRFIERGRILYRANCAVCHGDSGKGNGPQAKELTPPPPDLTRLSTHHGGRFPREAVYEVIDGRRLPAGHAGRDMPAWGLSLRELGVDADQDDMVRGRILQLVLYLESIQPASAMHQPESQP